MKVCNKCGDEIYTKDGVNLCKECQSKNKKKRNRELRKQRDAMLRDLGLVKVRGAMGGTYWE